MKIKLGLFEQIKNYQISSGKKKIFFTLFILFVYRLGNNIPLPNIDQTSLTNSLSSSNPFSDPLLLYTNEKSSFISFFFLGIGPYINSSFLVDLLTPLFFENFLEEEGNEGRKKLSILKKILSIFFAFIQGFLFLQKIEPFLFLKTQLDFSLTLAELIAGSIFVVWMTNSIDKYGIGKGTSLIVLLNILISGFDSFKNIFFSFQNLDATYFGVIPLVLTLFFLNRSSKSIRITNAKQSEYLKNNTIKSSSSNFLKLKLNRAGILPLIIASNLFGFLGSIVKLDKVFSDFIYYSLIVFCTCFYNSISFDCEKVAENFRKQSVVIIDNNQVITPGQKTTKFLENKLFLISIIYSFSLIILFFTCNLLKGIYSTSSFFSQLNLVPLFLASNILSDFSETFKSLYYQEKIENLTKNFQNKN